MITVDGAAPRGGKSKRSPSFKKQTGTALDLAEAKGWERVLVKTSEGNSFQFDRTVPPANPAVAPNPFDVLPPRSKRGH